MARTNTLVGRATYIVMRVWSGVFFIPEMPAFQQAPLDAPPSAELTARVEAWTSLSLWREPLDVLSFLCFLLAVDPPILTRRLDRDELAPAVTPSSSPGGRIRRSEGGFHG